MLRHDALREREHLFRRARVERRRVLVEQQKLRRHHRRHQKRQRLPLTAREQTDGLAQTVLQSHVELRELGAEELAVLGRDAAERIAVRRTQIREGKVFLNAHVRRSAAQRVLKQPPDDTAAVVLTCKGNVLAIQQDASLVHIKAARDGVEERGLARAVRADNGDEIALVEMERQIGNGALFVHRSNVEGLGDVLNVQHISCPPSLLPRPCGAGTPPTFGCSARRWPAPR